MNKGSVYCLMAILLTALLFAVNLCVGAVRIPLHDVFSALFGTGEVRESWRFIVVGSRLPQAITAMLSGGAFSLTGFAAIFVAAFAGAMAVMAVIFFFSTIVRNNTTLLIIGIMIGYLSSSAVSLLNFFATAEGVKSYLVWGLGNFGGVTMAQMPAFAAIVLGGLVAALLMVKPLNALLLGDRYAENLGVNIRMVRNSLLIITGVLTAIVTAFCGPVAFIGLAVPHVARLLTTTDDHRILMPATILTGAVVALLCNVLCVLPGDGGIIPLNAVTPLLGAPVIIYVILKSR